MSVRELDTVTDAGEVFVFRFKRSSTRVTAAVLGRKTTHSVETVWLDRLVHGIVDCTCGEWSLSGAVSSVLHRGIRPHKNLTK